MPRLSFCVGFWGEGVRDRDKEKGRFLVVVQSREELSGRFSVAFDSFVFSGGIEIDFPAPRLSPSIYRLHLSLSTHQQRTRLRRAQA